MRTFTWVCVATVALSTSPAGADLKAPSPPAPRKAAAREELVYVRNPDGVIVPARLADWFHFGPGRYFTPTEAEVRTLEAALPAFFRGVAKGEPEGGYVTPAFLRALPRYKRQYVGLDDQPHRRIWVNTTCADGYREWHDQPIAVDDGGACFWRVTYDLVTHLFSRLEFNGEA